MKSLYFAKRARKAGAMDIAEIFEQAAASEAQRALAHLDILYPRKRKPGILGAESVVEEPTGTESLDHSPHASAEIYPVCKSLPKETGTHAVTVNFDVPVGESGESKQYASDFKGFLESSAHRPTPGTAAATIAAIKPVIRPYRAKRGDAAIQ